MIWTSWEEKRGKITDPWSLVRLADMILRSHEWKEEAPSKGGALRYREDYWQGKFRESYVSETSFNPYRGKSLKKSFYVFKFVSQLVTTFPVDWYAYLACAW